VIDRAREALGSSRAFRREWERALQRLKLIVENDQPVARVAVAGSDRVAAFPA
jgi:hypothetical protein